MARLSLLQGGPASGKSLLAHACLKEGKIPFFWYSVDKADQDSLVFFQNLISGLQYSFPEKSFESAQMVASLNQNPSSLRSFIASFSDDLDRNFDKELVIVLDEAHHLYRNPDIPKLMVDFVQFLPEHIRVLLVSHPASVPEFLMLQLQNELSEVLEQDIVFNALEIQAYAELLNVNLAENEAQNLFDKTQGWVGGICLLLQLSKRQPNLPVASLLERRESDALLYDYFLREWLVEHPEDMRAFLFKTAFFPVINSDICQNIFQSIDVEECLQTIFNYQLFAYPVEGKGMMYHPSFRNYLQNEFKRSFPQDVQQEFYRQLATIISDNFPEDALELLFEIEAYTEIEALLKQYRHQLLHSHRYDALQNYLERIPESYRQQHPQLQVYLADVLRQKGLLDQAKYLLEQIKTSDDIVRGYVQLYEAAIACQKGQVNEALDMVSRSDVELLTQSEKEATAFQANLKGVCHLISGDVTPAVQSFKRAYEHYAQLSDIASQAKILHNEGLAYTWSGQLQEAQQAYTLSRELLGENQFVIPPMTAHNLAIVNMYLGEFQKAQTLLESAYEMAQKLGQQTEQIYTLSALGRLYTHLKKFSTAATFLEQANTLNQKMRNPMAETYYSLIQAENYCAQGQFKNMQQLLENLQEQSPTVSDDPRSLEWHMKWGELALLSGDLTQAEATLVPVEKGLRKKGYHYHFARVSFLLAKLYSLKKSPQGSTYRQQALSICQEFNYQQLLNEYESVQTESIEPPKTEASPEATFEFKLFGKVMGYHSKEMIPTARWGGKKTKLLLAIFLQEKEGLDWQQIGQRLYPEQDVKRSSVNAVITRLRKALETESHHHVILFAEGLYRFNSALHIQVDSHDLEFYLKQIHKVPEHSSQQIDAIEKALSYYHGEFLQEFSAVYWVQLEQERYRRLIRDTYQLLFEIYFKRKQYKEIVQWADKGMRKDVCFEEAHLAKLQALEHLGNRRGVVQHYRRLSKIFEKELGLPPPEEAQEIYERLTRGSKRKP